MAERIDRLERLTNLMLELTYASKPLTRDELTEWVKGYEGDEETKRTAFMRDKRLLIEQGIEVRTEPVPLAPENTFGYRIHTKEAFLDLRALDGDELRALQLAVASVRVDGFDDVDPAVKIGDAASSLPFTATLPGAPLIAVARSAAKDRAPLTFRYRDKPRTLHTYKVLFRFGFWYLVGLEIDAGEVRSFRVDRVQGDAERGEPGTYEIPEGFDVDEHLAPDPLMIGGGDAVESLVLVDAGHAARVRHEVGDQAVAEERDDGSIVVRRMVANRDAFRSWLFGLLDHAEVLAPDDLRAEVVSWLRSIADGGRAA